MIYHVSVNGCDRAAGTQEAPFRTISRAAEAAIPGDTVRVHEGVYREWVKPPCAGLSDVCRITYEAAPGEKAVIKGSEVVTGWVRDDSGLWTASVPNSIFEGVNPFAEPIYGDWLLEPLDKPCHTGDVYLNGKAMYEAFSVEEVRKAEPRTRAMKAPHDPRALKHPHPEETVYQWFAEVGEEMTTFRCNFQDVDPNGALVEITARRSCFYPVRQGVNYITVRGFEMAQAATPWAPPTADQPGVIGPHWSKGWIIEYNDLHDCKGPCVSLGKDELTGHNLHKRFGRKPGYSYQMEAVFLALKAGWSKETVGSHIVRHNTIHDCGQNGVVGHMGCAFSVIEHNHIYNIAAKHEYFGFEIAGIKFHAPIDAIIRDNCIHDCTLGVWLDWEAQGTRVTGNVLFGNHRDFMIEVSHGPCLVDSNIFASEYNFDNCAQGTAFIGNLCCGWMRYMRVMERSTPYHFPHSTQVAGCIFTYLGDDRLYNNIFTGDCTPPEPHFHVGTAGYDFCTTPEEYPALLEAQGNIDEGKYANVMQPVYLGGNVYCGRAKPFRAEADAVRVDEAMPVSVRMEDNRAVLRVNLPAEALRAAVPVSTRSLGMPRMAEAPYDNPDGTPVDFAPDMLGVRRGEGAVSGPLANLKPGANTVAVWEA